MYIRKTVRWTVFSTEAAQAPRRKLDYMKEKLRIRKFHSEVRITANKYHFVQN